MKDNDSIETLECPTLVRNALLGAGIQTVSDLKEYIREYGCSGIRRMGTAGWQSVAQTLMPYTGEAEVELLSVLRKILEKGRYCRILQKNCPTDGECNICELSEVYRRFSSRAG